MRNIKMQFQRLTAEIKRGKSSGHMLRETAELSVMVFPYVLLLFVFHYLPMIGNILAFKRYNPNLGILKSPWVGFDNFKYFFTSNDAIRVLKNTVLYGIAFQIIGVVTALMLAVLLYHVHSKIALKYYQTTIILPTFLSMVLVAYITYAMLNPTTGILNMIIQRFGFEGRQWYSNTVYWYGFIDILCGADRS